MTESAKLIVYIYRTSTTEDRMSPCLYFRPSQWSGMATLAIVPALVRKAYHVVGLAVMAKSDGIIVTTDAPVKIDDRKVLGLIPLEEL